MVLLTITIVVLLYVEPADAAAKAKGKGKGKGKGKTVAPGKGKGGKAGKMSAGKKGKKGGMKGGKKVTTKKPKPVHLQCYAGTRAHTVQKCTKDALCYKQVTTSGEVLRGCDKKSTSYSLCKRFKSDKCEKDKYHGLVCCCTKNKCNGAEDMHYSFGMATVAMILSSYLITTTT